LATLKVHNLANELGVKSKAIIEKCAAEGLDSVKTHMSPVSAGLAATIREWFSEGDHSSTIESTEKVNLEKVRVKKKPTKKEEVLESEVEAPAEEAQQETPGEGAEAVEAVEEESKAEPVAEIEEQQEVIEEPVAQEPAAAEEQEPEEPQAAQPEEPKAPERVMPAGPINKPTPAVLSGPRVVRVEAPEPQRPIRPRSPISRPGAPGQRPPMGQQRPPMGGQRPAPGGARPGIGAPPRGRFDKPAPAQPVPAPIDDHKKKKVKDKYQGPEEEKKPTKLLKLRERDMAERRAKLDAAGGENIRFRPVRKIEHKSHEASAKTKPEKIAVYEPITVRELAAALGCKITEIITKLMRQGKMVTANQALETETAELLALEFGAELVITKRKTLEEHIAKEFDDRQRTNMQKRSTVVTVLGHVDHGKTSLLDKIRNANVAAGEAGGITQHIGAYQVAWDEKKVTFLDTPGHEAFTAMRARGANMTDVVVLVVAADDGVMPQTIEAIHHAKAANVPIIVALNKIDLPGVDLHRIYGQLAEHELVPTEWGGKTEIVKTSAITGLGVPELLEYLDYTSELLELKADNSIPATGWVVESKMTSSQGAVATVLVKEGVMEKGDIVLAGGGYGRIRTLKDSYGRPLEKAISAMPVEISGLSAVPSAGDRFYIVDDINKAKAAAEENLMLSREENLARKSTVTLDNVFSQIAAGAVKELSLIIRADVQGSVDVLIKYLGELSTQEVKIKILHAGVGGVTEGDVILAEASKAIIIGFNVVADDQVKMIAENKGVDIRFYNIIYRITEDLKKAMAGLLEPEQQEKVLGRAHVRNTFKVSGVGTVAGCYVTSGVVQKGGKVRLIRNNIVLKDGIKIDSLKHFKDDVREVKTNFECGIKLAGYDDVKVDDVYEIYEIIEVARTL